MKPRSIQNVNLGEPSEELTRDYAYHLYQQSGSIPGRDLDNWLEARACLCANVPKASAHVRLHRHTSDNPKEWISAPPVSRDNGGKIAA